MEELLEYLCRFGHPTLWRLTSNKWACMMDVFVVRKGVSFKVECIGVETPIEALRKCKETLDAAISDIAKTQPALKG